MIWAVNDDTVIHYMETMTDVELYRAPREEFIKFMKNNNEVMFEFTSKMLTRMAGLLRRMEYAMFGNARSKVASTILICAERFGNKDKGGNIIIQVPLTHQDIARLIGMARETISIEMKKLQKMGLLDYRGKYLIVKDIQTLLKESALGPVD